MNTKSLTPAIQAKIVDQINEYYNLVLSKIDGSTYETWQKAEKDIVEKLGYNYQSYQKWCKENLEY